MTLDVHYSTGKDDWETPDDLYSTYDGLFHFVIDAAANANNHKCDHWFGPAGVCSDALAADWGPWLKEGNIWLNPPYSRGLQSKFVKKAWEEVNKAWQGMPREWHDPIHTPGHVVCLLPARTDTKLFHEIIQPNADVTFLKGRVRFKGAAQGAPFPSMIVVF